jgi:Ni/Co efflux regulator RcnB
MVRLNGKMILAVVAGIVLAATVEVASAFGEPSFSLDWQEGVPVSKSQAFKDTAKAMCHIDGSMEVQATVCLRLDTGRMYVINQRNDGYFKLGNWKSDNKVRKEYRCQDDYGVGQWVMCSFSWPRKGWYWLRVGQGQDDWYILAKVAVWPYMY